MGLHLLRWVRCLCCCWWFPASSASIGGSSSPWPLRWMLDAVHEGIPSMKGSQVFSQIRCARVAWWRSDICSHHPSSLLSLSSGATRQPCSHRGGMRKSSCTFSRAKRQTTGKRLWCSTGSLPRCSPTNYSMSWLAFFLPLPSGSRPHRIGCPQPPVVGRPGPMAP